MRTRAALALLVLALALAPTVGAAWRGIGTHEPDSTTDVERGRMHFEPDTRPYVIGETKRVYFDAFPTLGGPAEGTPTDGATVNPNVGTLGTRIAMGGLVEYRALLGVWKDCNHDGYIGQAEGAIQDYRAELPRDPLTCPVGSPYNDGLWVSEFLFIGMVDPCEYKERIEEREACPSTHYGPLPNSDSGSIAPAYVRNVRVIYANGTYVWGDEGLPGAAPALSCALRPAPRGTTASTGGMLGLADCQLGFAAGHNANAASAAADPDDRLGLRFEDAERPAESTSALNQRLPVNLFGDPTTGSVGLLQRGSGRPATTAWDCDGEATLDARDPTAREGERGEYSEVVLSDPSGGSLTGPKIIPVAGTRTVFRDEDRNAATPGVFRQSLTDHDGSYASVPAPAPGAVDAGGSTWDGAEEIADGPVPTGDCDPETDSSLRGLYVGALVESDAARLTRTRTQPSVTMWFFDGYRGFQSGDPYLNTYTTPSDGGLAYTRNLFGGAMWSATAASPADPHLVDRYHQQAEDARHTTFYARIPPSAISTHGLELPRAGAATYGFEACGSGIGPGAPIVGGWACDPDAWWRGASGDDVTLRYAGGDAFGQRVGALYDMLDVDCYDGRVVDGAYATLQLLTPMC